MSCLLFPLQNIHLHRVGLQCAGGECCVHEPRWEATFEVLEDEFSHLHHTFFLCAHFEQRCVVIVGANGVAPWRALGMRDGADAGKDTPVFERLKGILPAVVAGLHEWRLNTKVLDDATVGERLHCRAFLISGQLLEIE